MIDNDNDLRQGLIDDNGNINSNNNQINDNENINDDHIYYNEANNNSYCGNSFLGTSLFLILITYFLYSEIYSLYYFIIYFQNKINTTSDSVFERCIKYPSLNEIYKSILFLLIIIDLFLFMCIFEINNEELVSKIFYAFIHFNYYLFGPVLTGFSTLGLIFYDKICFYCLNDDPSIRNFDFSIFLVFLLSLFLGINILLGYNGLDTFNFLIESLGFKEGSNYFLGKLFWKTAQWRRRMAYN